jgi:hypothetical protein
LKIVNNSQRKKFNHFRRLETHFSHKIEKIKIMDLKFQWSLELKINLNFTMNSQYLIFPSFGMCDLFVKNVLYLIYFQD